MYLYLALHISTRTVRRTHIRTHTRAHIRTHTYIEKHVYNEYNVCLASYLTTPEVRVTNTTKGNCEIL